MKASEHRQNVILTKLSVEELEELHERQKNILKNKKLVHQLPDKGKQLQEKLDTVEKELQLRRDLKELEGGITTLAINYQKSEVLKENHVQYVCNKEKSPKKERYKPFATLVHKDEKKSEKPTQMIPLVESMTLLAEQVNTLPFEQIKKAVEGTPMKEEHEASSDIDENPDQPSDSESEETEKT